MRATWLAGVLRDAGCKVVELDGWETRTAHYSSGRPHELVSIDGVVWHHTATGTNWTVEAVLDMLRDGRSDLDGPLAQLGLDRDGTYYVIAAGRANHNGYGDWGNDAIGIEAFNRGTGEPWPQVQIDAYDLGTAAILAHLAYGAERMRGHRETDPRRKPDPVGIDLDAARTRIARLIAGGLHPQPKDWFDMATEAQLRKIVSEELDERFNPDGKGNLLVRIRDAAAKNGDRLLRAHTKLNTLLRRP